MKFDLRNCDCMELMREFPDKYFDLAIVDPPYGIGNFIPQSGKHTGDNFKKIEWNNSVPDKEYFAELIRVSKNQIIWGANYYNSFKGKKGAIVWYKHVVHPNMSKCEIASCTLHKKVEYIDLIWQSINREEATIHPCQKPVKLYRWLLKKYAKPGDKILDTHLGSGSIAIACHYLNLDLTGSEKDPVYFENLEKRIKEETLQLTMI